MPARSWRGAAHRIARSPLRHLAAPLYGASTALGLAGVRARDALTRNEPRRSDLDRVTAIVKTFERPRSLARLLDSLARHYPEVFVIVADDGRRPRARASGGIRWLVLPYDSGVSAGRQAALDCVETTYTWLLDDDFVLYGGSRLSRVVELLDRYPELDLVGGAVINLPLFQKSRSDPRGIHPTARPPRLPLGRHPSGLEICDKVPNYYVARTESLRRVGWTPELKRIDHADFFTRARGVLASAYCDEFRCLHCKTPFDRKYMRHRLDCQADREILRARHGSS